jgi:type II secretory pathway component HofQ
MIRSSKRCGPIHLWVAVWFFLWFPMGLFAGITENAPAADPSPLVSAASAPKGSGDAVAQTRRSYSFQDLDIRQALSALAQDQEINLIMSPEVIGKISVHLNQRTLDEALLAITMAGGFTYRKQEELY